MTVRHRLRAAAFVGLLAFSSPDHSLACAFHTVLPQASLTQQIINAAAVIAARPSVEDPFRYETVEVLKGAADNLYPPYIVDSVTRARLARNPDEAVLFVRDADGTWARLLLLDEATRPLVHDVLSHSTTWYNVDGKPLRHAYFVPLLAAPDARLRKIALRELDALPYSVLRKGSYPVDADMLLKEIGSLDEAPFAPIRILLLGLDGSELAKTAIDKRLQLMARLGIDTNLGAWLTAHIENRGMLGFAEFEQNFLSSSLLNIRQAREIARALSLLSAEGDPDLRSAIDRTVRRLASVDPDIASLIVRAFANAADYSQAELVRELVAAGVISDVSDFMVAVDYINRAEGQQDHFGNNVPRSLLNRDMIKKPL